MARLVGPDRGGKFGTGQRVRILTIGLFLGLVGCQKLESERVQVSDRNLVHASNEDVRKEISANFEVQSESGASSRLQETTMEVLTESQLQGDLRSGKLLPTSDSRSQSMLSQVESRTRDVFSHSMAIAPAAPAQPPARVSRSLLLSYPISLIGQKGIFGAVITKVSDRTNENLGGLKLADLTLVHVTTRLVDATSARPRFLVSGCVRDCTEQSPSQLLFEFPVQAVDVGSSRVVLDLAGVGDDFNLLGIMDPTGRSTGLGTLRATTTAVDLVDSMVIFDVETEMVPLRGSPQVSNVTFLTRWFLRVGGLDNVFQTREATPGVGLFMTERALVPKVTRFSVHSPSSTSRQRSVHYFVKDVPQEWRPAFSAALDGWNEKFRQMLGHDLISYEFLDASDARHDLVIAGDIRYNVIEWDLVNQAPYGGYGPSIANQLTGEMVSANVLIQGPRIIELYQAWHQASLRVTDRLERGRVHEAEEIMRRFSEFLAVRQSEASRLTLSAGHLPFHIRSQDASHFDPLAQRNDFDLFPRDIPTFAEYMNGYFQEMVAHEIGHNLGLRHNFRGNLGSQDQPRLGRVSRSIMEYLGRLSRHFNRISEYDIMAIAYAYLGQQPTELNWFCTDENKANSRQPSNSAECTSDDDSNDPFEYFVSRVSKGVALLVARGRTTPPAWVLTNMDREMTSALNGIFAYAANPVDVARTYTNFYGRRGRPSDASQVRAYVISRLRDEICSSSLAAEVAAKSTTEGRTLTQANVDALRLKVIQVAGTWGIAATDVTCQ